MPVNIASFMSAVVEIN